MICKTDISKAITLLRFPLIVGVVFLHSFPLQSTEIDWNIFNGEQFYRLFCIVTSYILPIICTPAFFFISGYLFFLNVEKFNRQVYVKKLYKRVKTLLIPYVLWNMIPYIIHMIMVIVKGGDFFSLLSFSCFINIFWNEHSLNDVYNWAGWPIMYIYPLNGALWYLRDLILLSVISPLVWIICKKTKQWGLLVVTFLYIFSIWPFIPLHMKSFVFFVYGSYFAIIGSLSFFEKYRMFFIFVSLFSFLLLLSNNIIITDFSRPIFIIFTVFSIISISVNVVRKGVVINDFFVRCVFFIYVAHSVYIQNVVRGVLSPAIFGSNFVSAFGMIIRFLFVPCCTILFCIFLFYLMKLLFPSILKVLNGGRV